MAHVKIEITPEMKTAREECETHVVIADCGSCPCRIGEDDCIFNHNVVD